MGGLHYSLTLLWSQLTTIGSAVLYLRYYEPPEGNETNKISARALYAVVVSLAATGLVFFLLVLSLVNRSHVSTLLGTTSGKRFTIEAFLKGDDFQKQDIFTVNQRHWSSIRQEVIEWTHMNWATWIKEETRPEWFNHAFVARVPDEFIPKELLVPKDKRRKSIFGEQKVPVPATTCEDALGM